MIDFDNLTKCPLCGSPLLTEFGKGNSLTKGCRNRIDHWWLFEEEDPFWSVPFLKNMEGRKSLGLMIDMKNQIYIKWLFNSDTMWVVKGKSWTRIPWVEPDFENYRKLVKKLRTLVVFS